MHQAWLIPELVELFLDALEMDRPTLAALSRVCKCLSLPAIARLYETLDQAVIEAISRIAVMNRGSDYTHLAGPHEVHSRTDVLRVYTNCCRSGCLDVCASYEFASWKSALAYIQAAGVKGDDGLFPSLDTLSANVNTPGGILLASYLCHPQLEDMDLVVVRNGSSAFADLDWDPSVTSLFHALRAPARNLRTLRVKGHVDLGERSMQAVEKTIRELHAVEDVSLDIEWLTPIALTALGRLPRLITLSLWRPPPSPSAEPCDRLSASLGRIPYEQRLVHLQGLHLQTDVQTAASLLQCLLSPLSYLRLTVQMSPEDTFTLKSLATAIARSFKDTLLYLSLRLKMAPDSHLRQLEWFEFRPLQDCKKLLEVSLKYRIFGRFEFHRAQLLALAKWWPRLEYLRCEWWGCLGHPLTTLTIQDVLELAKRMVDLKVIVLTAISWLDRSCVLPLGTRLQTIILGRAFFEGAESWVATMWALACPFTEIRVGEAATQHAWRAIEEERSVLLQGAVTDGCEEAETTVQRSEADSEALTLTENMEWEV